MITDEITHDDARRLFGNVLAEYTEKCISRNNIYVPMVDAYLKLNDAVKSDTPKRLYKYSSDNGSDRRINDILLGRLHLSSPALFNDKLDVNPYFDSDFIEAQMEDQITLSKTQAVLESQRKLIPANATLLYDKTTYEIIQNFSVYKLRCIADTKATIQQHFEKYRSGICCACLCEAVDSAPMWAHYSDNGKGFAVEYSVTAGEVRCTCNSACSNESMVFTLCPIQYTGRYDISNLAHVFMGSTSLCPYPNELSYLAMINAVSFKKPEWSYEKEWRLVCMQCPSRNSSYAALGAKALFLGEDSSEDMMRSLYHLSTSLSIPLYKMQTDTSCRTGNLKPVQLQ